MYDTRQLCTGLATLYLFSDFFILCGVPFVRDEEEEPDWTLLKSKCRYASAINLQSL